MSSFLHRLRARLRTPILHNTGSVARDHLASERTFLAWLRTGLGFIALGIAIERFSQLDLGALLEGLDGRRGGGGVRHGDGDGDGGALALLGYDGREGRGVGGERGGRGGTGDATGAFRASSDGLVGALLGTGSGSIAYGTHRYFSNFYLLEQGLFKPAFHGAAVLGIAVAGLAGTAYWAAARDREDRGVRDRNRERERSMLKGREK